jgi:TPR repeat protein
MLAEMMLNSEDEGDHSAALALFERAALQGHASAMFALGALHNGGYSVPENRALAQHWFHKAAEGGHPHAQLMVARYLTNGLAGVTDPAAAQQWLEAAYAAGVTEAELGEMHPNTNASLSVELA